VLRRRITLGTCAGSALRTERPAGHNVRKLRESGRGHMAPPQLSPPYRLAWGLSAAHILYGADGVRLRHVAYL
jgi:hypothetical protein